MIEDKAGKDYWEKTEANRRLLGPVFDGRAAGLKNLAKRRLHSYFVDVFSDRGPESSLLEIGCGGSRLLPYFSSEFGFSVSGIDYSESGCQTAREICRLKNCPANIVCTDLFQASPDLKGAFDIVVSFGVVEHFSETVGALEAFKRFLRPGGIMITSVPNLGGVPGMMQKLINREIFEKHMVLSVEALRSAHRSAGLRVRRCEYHLFSNFGMINPGSSGLPRRMLWHGLRAITGFTWAVESVVGTLPPNWISSPYVFCLSEFETNQQSAG